MSSSRVTSGTLITVSQRIRWNRRSIWTSSIQESAKVETVDVRVAAIKQPQHCNEVRLRLDCDDMGTDAAEDANSIADMCTNVESKITSPKKPPVERLHPAAAPHRDVVGDQRTADARSPPEHVSSRH